MNERIRELLSQVGVHYEVMPKDTVYEKFAEMIVKECSKISEDDVTDGDACCTNTADRIARQIKKHFGVEE